LSATPRVLAPFGVRRATIAARERYGAYTVMRCHDPDGPRPRAGQFYMLRSLARWGGGRDERPYLPRAFSVLRAPSEDDRLEFLIEDVGPGTERLCELGPGSELALLGPLGNGFGPPEPGRRPLLVGGGVGIAPLAILQDQLPAGDGTVLLGFRDAAHAAGAELLRGAQVATDDGSAGHHGLVTALLARELDRDRGALVYACGPPPMLEAVRLICSERGIRSQLALESGMACGYGACFGCVVATDAGYIRLCVDGPVVEGDRLQSALTPGSGHR
jgi:dihydroorotate dehydrogenase electron transfer subunit